jgi:hypothetical protein
MNTTLSNDFNLLPPDRDPANVKRIILYVVVFPLLILLIFFLLFSIYALVVYLYKNVSLYFLLFIHFIISTSISYFFIKRTLINGKSELQKNDKEYHI